MELPQELAFGFQWFLAFTKYKLYKKETWNSGVQRCTSSKWRWKNMFIQIIWTNLQHITISAPFCQVNPKFTLWDLPTTVGRNISRSLSSAWKAWRCTAPLGGQGIVPLTKMCKSKPRGQCCSSAPPGCLCDTSRLGSKGRSAESRI